MPTQFMTASRRPKCVIARAMISGAEVTMLWFEAMAERDCEVSSAARAWAGLGEEAWCGEVPRSLMRMFAPAFARAMERRFPMVPAPPVTRIVRFAKDPGAAKGWLVADGGDMVGN